jgi:hypothetical protein
MCNTSHSVTYHLGLSEIIAQDLVPHVHIFDSSGTSRGLYERALGEAVDLRPSGFAGRYLLTFGSQLSTVYRFRPYDNARCGFQAKYFGGGQHRADLHCRHCGATQVVVPLPSMRA